MSAAALQAELAETCALVAAEARDLGHDPHPWGRREALLSRTACRRCGALLEVRVSAGGVSVRAAEGPCS